MFEDGPVGNRSQASIRNLGGPEAPTQRNVSIRLQSLLGLPFCSGVLARCSLNLVPASSYLAVFALEIIDAGLCIRQLTLVIFHFLAELLMLELPIVQLEIHIL